ncbi:MAG: alpha-L-fucosidase [Sediminibacterium sp.]|nr:alpha-L-fucosidase [Sediminibacterium sp.]
MQKYYKAAGLVLIMFCMINTCYAQKMEEMWDTGTIKKEHPDLTWFANAKFGLFIHWGLYSKLAGEWKGKRYYGSGEWIMNQAKIPAAEYAKVALEFNPVNFDAGEWTKLAKDAGIKYIVITAKHHEGFAMFDSKVSNFTIVKASPYKKDPMKALAAAAAKQGIHFGFYYSQFVDWHEPNGGRNNWDFDETKKKYEIYYRDKAIPQLKELLTNYGPLGIVWFDLPGGLTRQETQSLVNSLHALQPQSLFSSRVGQGMGDYKDFGDSEIPPVPINGAWESIFTHNDSWGYIEHDMNFKSAKQIIQLLASVVSKGGNLMLNVGPDGNGNIPAYSEKYLRETGKWLAKNGESIYNTTYGFIPAQPWGVTSSKPGKLFLHVFNHPFNNKLLVPRFSLHVNKVYQLTGKKMIPWHKQGNDVILDIPPLINPSPNTVFVIEYSGTEPAYDSVAPIIVSPHFAINPVEAITAKTSGDAAIKSITFSHYFGDWKHATCVTGQKIPGDSASFQIRVTEAGDYKLILEYACPQESARQEGSVTVNGKEYLFKTLRTSEIEKSAPILFIKHPVVVTTITTPGVYSIVIRPMQQGKELFKLKTVIFEPLSN